MGLWNSIKGFIPFFGGESTVDTATEYLDFGSGTSKSKIRVDEDKSLSIPTYFACIKYISDDIGKLPKNIYERQESGKLERVFFHPFDDMLNKQANAEMTSFASNQTSLQYLLAQGNGVSEIIFDGKGKEPDNIIGYVPIHPSRVKCDRIDGELLYTVRPAADDVGGKDLFLKSNEVIHFKGFGTGYWGHSVLRYQIESLGLSLAATRLAANFFGNGTVFGSVIESKRPIKETPMAKLRARLVDFRKPQNQFRSLILDGEQTYKQIGVPLREAQFIELLDFTVKEIARWFRMPLHKLGHLEGAKFNNVEMINIDYIANTLSAIAIMTEQEWNCKLFESGSRFVIKHDFKPLLLADSKTRSEWYRTLFQAGGLKPEEIREEEGMPPGDPAGDKQYIQTSMISLELLDEMARKKVFASPANQASAGKDNGNNNGDEDGDEDEAFEARVESFKPILEQVSNEILNKEFLAISRLSKSDKDEETKKGQVVKFYKTLTADAVTKFGPVFQVFMGNDRTIIDEVCEKVMTDQSKIIENHIVKDDDINDHLFVGAAFLNSITMPFKEDGRWKKK